MIDVFIARPGPVFSNTHEGRVEFDGVRSLGYDRFAGELEATGGLTVTLVDAAEPPNATGVLLHQSSDFLGSLPGAIRRRCLLVEAAGNEFALMARLGLLGAVTWEGWHAWRQGDPSHLRRSLAGRRDVAESLVAVGDPIGPLHGYCYLCHSGWTSLPQALGDYLRHLPENR